MTLLASIQSILDKVEALAAAAAWNDKDNLTALQASLSTVLSESKQYTDAQLNLRIAALIGDSPLSADTLKELNDMVVAVSQADAGLISTASAQSFTEEQQAQGRSNLGAASTAIVANVLSQAASAATSAANAVSAANAAAISVASLSTDIGSIADIATVVANFNPVQTFIAGLE